MFRSLSARLTASYVFAAIVLVVIVVGAVTAFVLSMYGIGAREEADAVARQAPEVVRLETTRSGSIVTAAPSIVRELSRPGIRVAVFSSLNGHRIFLAASVPDGPDGRLTVIRPQQPATIVGMLPRVSVPASRAQALTGDDRPLDGPAPNARGFTHEFMQYQPPPAAYGASAGDGAPPDAPDGGPAGENGHGPYGARPYPLGLSAWFHILPRTVDVAGTHIAILPDPGPLERTINLFWLAMIPIGIFVVGAAWLLGRLITHAALRPLVETTASLERFGEGDFTPHPVETVERNEIGALAIAYNRAAAQVALAFEERSAVEDQMRQFIADAGHELRTPLTVIMGFIDVLRKRSASDSSSAKIFDTMLEESRRMKTLIDKLIVLARLENQPRRELQTVDLAEVARGVVESLRTLSSASIAFSADIDALVRGDEAELHDAVTNLVENALKYAPDSPVEVNVRDEGSLAIVEIADRGPGIPFDEQSQVFERFYRGRDRSDAEGFGLGLAIAKRAVERAGGEIRLASSPGNGSRFSIRIPLAGRAVAVAS